MHRFIFLIASHKLSHTTDDHNYCPPSWHKQNMRLDDAHREHYHSNAKVSRKKKYMLMKNIIRKTSEPIEPSYI